jgi:hypothetical protein
MPNTVRTVADILALAEWPAEQLRLVGNGGSLPRR